MTFTRVRSSLGLVALALWFACSGQVCGPAPIERPAVVDLGIPIPQGTYYGEMPATSTAYLGALPLSTATDTLKVTQAFGADGTPVTETGEPLAPGHTTTEDFPGGSNAMTVRAIEPVVNGFRVTYDASMNLDVNGQSVTLTGTTVRTYQLNAELSIDVEVTLDIGTGGPSGFIRMTMQAYGQLYRS